jgi:hypothetical protein
MGNPARFGSEPRSEPQHTPGSQGGRREAPYGPEVSWPYGFRPLDDESREVLESAYGTGPLNPGYGAGSVYQPQTLDDYGDPGYSDPSYEGPSYGGSPYSGRSGSAGGSGYSGGNAAPPSPSGSGGFGTPRGFGGDSRRPSGSVPGYQLPEAPRVQDSRRSGYQSPASDALSSDALSSDAGIWPVTGAQEALPDTGSRPSADRRGHQRSGQPGYPDQWYGHPRMDDRAPDDQRSSRSPDPRLEGITYGELRYDDTGSFAAARSDQEPEYRAEPLDEEAWYQELRQSGPAFRPNPPVPPSPISGPPRRVDPLDPLGPSFGSSSGGYSQPQDRGPGGQPRWDGPGRPQMNAGPSAGRPAGRGAQSGPQNPQAPAAPGGKPAAGTSPAGASASGVSQASGFLSAPAASVGLLTPPGGTRVDALRDGGAPPAAPASKPAPAAQAAPVAPAAPVFTSPAEDATRAFEAVKAPERARSPRPASVRPGHGLDGPSITGSWPTQPASDDLESYDDFWRDDADEEYTGLFGDREAEFKRAAAKQAAGAKRQTGRRRGRSNDHRLWLGLGAVVVVAAAAIGGIVKFEFGSHQDGPAHNLATPATIGDYSRTKNVERQADLDALKEKLIKATGGQASGFVTAIYESGNSAAGNDTQIVMFVGAHLANADPDASIAAFKQLYKGAEVVSAGPGGGKAVCVQGGKAEALCAWFDNDSMGIVDSPSMKATALAEEMQAMRPSVELKAKG